MSMAAGNTEASYGLQQEQLVGEETKLLQICAAPRIGDFTVRAGCRRRLGEVSLSRGSTTRKLWRAGRSSRERASRLVS